jgi:hypothetical protein
MFTDGSLPDGGSRPRVLAPETQRACAPLALRVVGLPARAVVQLSTTTVDGRGHRWRAEAAYYCGDTVVDVARDASIAGSYLGVDPDGLLTSMRSVRRGIRGAGWFVPPSPRGFSVWVDVRIGTTTVASTTIDRVLVQPGVTGRPFTISGETFGVAWQPPSGQRRRPPVVVVAPARSPMAVHAPGLLASRGYPTVSIPSRSGRRSAAVPPFGRRELRAEDLHLGLIAGADRAGIDLYRAVLIGVAGGSKLAAGLAAMLPELAAVVAYPPARRSRPIGVAGWRWLATAGWRTLGPGRLPGDAGGRAGQRAGGATWDLLLDLLRELSISPGAAHAGGLTPPVSPWPPARPGHHRSVR